VRDVAGWIRARPAPWKERIQCGALDMSATYAAVDSVTLPKTAQVVDPFQALDSSCGTFCIEFCAIATRKILAARMPINSLW
jgi:hypothetical protein